MARDIEAGRAYVRVSTKDDLSKGLRRISGKLKTWGATVAGIGTKMVGMGAAMGAPFLAAIKAASDMEETMNKFNVVFGESADEVKAWSDGFAASVGRSKKQIADFMAGSQDLFVPLGFAADAARDLSEQITGLAVDLASFNNLADDFVLRDLHAALTGSGEVMKKYGVIVSEAAVKQELLNQGMDPKTATDQMKVQARLNIILRGTTAAQGDALRSAGSFANQMKALRGTLHDTAVAIGSALLPVVTPLVTRLTEGVKLVADWAKENQGLVRSIAYLAVGVVAASGALLGLAIGLKLAGVAAALAAGVVSTAMAAFAAVTAGLKLALLALVSPLGLITLGIAAVTAAILTWTDTGQQLLANLQTDFGNALQTVKDTIGGIRDALSAGDLRLAAEIAWTGIKLAFFEAISTIRTHWIEFNKWIVDTLLAAAKKVLGAVQWMAKKINEAMAAPATASAIATSEEALKQGLADLEARRGNMSERQYLETKAKMQQRHADLAAGVIRPTDEGNAEIDRMFEGWLGSIDQFGFAMQQELDDDLRHGAERIAQLRSELEQLRVTAGEAAQTEKEQRIETAKTTSETPSVLGGARGASGGGTFSAMAASIMFAGESDNEKRIEENTRASARSLRRLEKWTIEGPATPTFT